MTNAIAIAIAAWALSAILVSELFGYPLHRLLHSGFIHFLSKNHMQHHLLLYGPLQKQRPSEEHLDATTGQVALGNIGLEWIIPAGILLIVLAGVFCFLRVGLRYQFLFFGIVLAWTFWVFSYLHDRMRIKGFWMERAPILRHWFCWARRLHDIRQRALNDRGLMDKNFGIGFAFFDWLFGTMASVQPPFNHAGLEVAQQKFDFVTRGQRQLRAAAKGLTIKKRTGGS
jgi:sterol desaturase/sphingolipid hydroxylase (fatty acid hydroxylase superfamily)